MHRFVHPAARAARPLRTTLRSSLVAVLFGVTLAGAARADHLSAALGVESSAAISTESAEPLARGAWAFALRGDHAGFDAFSDREMMLLRGADPGGDIHTTDSFSRLSLQLAHGLTDGVTLGLRLPYVERRGLAEPETGHCHGASCVAHDIIDHGDAAGLGDLGLFASIRLPAGAAADRRLALLVGIEAPTGATDRTGFRGERSSGISVPVPPEGGGHDHSHAGGRVETHLQPGSGSWDASLGLAYQQPLVRRSTLHASAVYTATTEGAQNTELGDSLALQLAVARPLRPASARVTVTAVLELSGEWQDGERRDGRRNHDSGGELLFLSPGLRLAHERWSLALSLGYPLEVALDGPQVEPEYRVLTSVGWTIGNED